MKGFERSCCSGAVRGTADGNGGTEAAVVLLGLEVPVVVLKICANSSRASTWDRNPLAPTGDRLPGESAAGDRPPFCAFRKSAVK